jgi:hypothetical protein
LGSLAISLWINTTPYFETFVAYDSLTYRVIISPEGF